VEIAGPPLEGRLCEPIIEHYRARATQFARNGLCGLALGPELARKAIVRAKDGLRRREKPIVSGYCHLFMVRREKKKVAKFQKCSQYGWGVTAVRMGPCPPKRREGRCD